MNTNPLRRPARQSPAQKAAERFLVSRGAVAAQSFDPDETLKVLAEAADHLVDRLNLSRGEARDLVLATWSEFVGRHAGAYIDLDASSPFMIVVVDQLQGGKRRAIPVADLLMMLGPRSVATR